MVEWHHGRHSHRHDSCCVGRRYAANRGVSGGRYRCRMSWLSVLGWSLLLLAMAKLPYTCKLSQHQVDQLELLLCRLDTLNALLYISNLLLNPLIDFQQPIPDSLHGRKIRRGCRWDIRLRYCWSVGPVEIHAHSIRQVCHFLSTLSKS